MRFRVFPSPIVTPAPFHARGKWHPQKFLSTSQIFVDPLRSGLVRSLTSGKKKPKTAAAHRGVEGRGQEGGL